MIAYTSFFLINFCWSKYSYFDHTYDACELSVWQRGKRICSTRAFWSSLQPKGCAIWHCAKELHLFRVRVGMSRRKRGGSTLWCQWWLSDLQSSLNSVAAATELAWWIDFKVRFAQSFPKLHTPILKARFKERGWEKEVKKKKKWDPKSPEKMRNSRTLWTVLNKHHNQKRNAGAADANPHPLYSLRMLWLPQGNA